MHLGSLAIIGQLAKENFLHILLNNFCHESVGGQPTAAKGIDFGLISKSLGYKSYIKISNIEDLTMAWNKISHLKGPNFLEIEIRPGSRNDLGRPKDSAKDNKINFMKFLSNE